MRQPAIERLLPAAFQRAAQPPSLLWTLLNVMESLHEPSEGVLAAVDDLFAPYRSPDRLVPFLLSWVAFDHVLPRGRDGEPTLAWLSLGRLRDLLDRSAYLSRRRGTAAGLQGVIETVTGVPTTVEEDPGREFHVLVRIPADAAPLVPLIARLVEAEKPAATTFEVIVDSADHSGPNEGE
jgi:phage tail-like protein